ncbi:MAG: hypothetical protein ABFS56_06705 [Pseudomonadota bacterium]
MSTNLVNAISKALENVNLVHLPDYNDGITILSVKKKADDYEIITTAGLPKWADGIFVRNGIVNIPIAVDLTTEVEYYSCADEETDEELEMSQVWVKNNVTKLASTIRKVFTGINEGTIGKYANLSSSNIDKRALVENLDKMEYRNGLKFENQNQVRKYFTQESFEQMGFYDEPDAKIYTEEELEFMADHIILNQLHCDFC